MCLFQRTGKQRQAPVRSEVEPFLAARSGDSRGVAEQQAAASWCWVGCERREGVTPPGRRPSGQMAWERPPWCLWPLDGGCGLKGRRVFSEGGPAKAGVCEGPSRALRIREMLDLLPLTLLELASGATSSCSCLAPVGENEGTQGNLGPQSVVLNQSQVFLRRPGWLGPRSGPFQQPQLDQREQGSEGQCRGPRAPNPDPCLGSVGTRGSGAYCLD